MKFFRQANIAKHCSCLLLLCINYQGVLVLNFTYKFSAILKTILAEYHYYIFFPE